MVSRLATGFLAVFSWLTDRVGTPLIYEALYLIVNFKRVVLKVDRRNEYPIKLKRSDGRLVSGISRLHAVNILPSKCFG